MSSPLLHPFQSFAWTVDADYFVCPKCNVRNRWYKRLALDSYCKEGYDWDKDNNWVNCPERLRCRCPQCGFTWPENVHISAPPPEPTKDELFAREAHAEVERLTTPAGERMDKLLKPIGR